MEERNESIVVEKYFGGQLFLPHSDIGDLSKVSLKN